MIRADDLAIKTLGPCKIASPRQKLLDDRECKVHFVGEEDKVVFDPSGSSVRSFLDAKEDVPMMERAGPKCNIHFVPAKVRAAIVTCGGLCPGINDAIRGIVMELYYRYKVRHVHGIQYGYQGFIRKYGHEALNLTPEIVTDIHKRGGTILKSSRGRQDSREIVEFLKRKNINILFAIGGDGTLRGALEIAEEVDAQKMKVSIVGIPKTIDNDILYLDQSFGFETAFSEACRSISCAHTEAEGAPNGIGLVKLMGRCSGFIACYAALAMNDVNFSLIPEVPFELEGRGGFLNALKTRIERRKHAVVVVAEGAGQELIAAGPSSAPRQLLDARSKAKNAASKRLPSYEDGVRVTDASGNVRLADIGLFLKSQINAFFKKTGVEVNVKYIDPSYMIRSVPASPQDSVYCLQLAENAVHAAMSGRTKMVVARRNGHHVYLPMTLVASGRKRVDPKGDLWRSVLEATGQPVAFKSQRYAKAVSGGEQGRLPCPPKAHGRRGTAPT